ncbi:hypothetical protein [Acinetobacter boissieri]|uniref:Uncharacterized protein n=1 Tax=Acinetobacter boissieri TaxID=1219383 RepID=A0A1G6KBX2_9GAMM|nr:hypothetical protein [Acinetobacter boissieri]SDC28454.1 hypothetical protein SAMN05421733_1162 [Acinetobacter boissieri]
MDVYHKTLEQSLVTQQQENAKQAIKSLNDFWSLGQISEQIKTPYAVLVDLIVGMPVDEIILSDVLEKLGV